MSRSFFGTISELCKCLKLGFIKIQIYIYFKIILKTYNESYLIRGAVSSDTLGAVFTVPEEAKSIIISVTE